MSFTEHGAGWLPAEAQDDLEMRRDAASHSAADALLALAPRERVLALLKRAAQGRDCAEPLRSADLIRVLASFEGTTMPLPAELESLCPGAVVDRA
ncbi:MAG TPA: hypothetical protein VD970_17080 [Acetobacteraceae bacterium]|nr:hypothetical protein [Acetobacteraceae bacterium]